jgi:hypothetical protein
MKEVPDIFAIIMAENFPPIKSSDETRNRRNVPQHNKGYI